MAQLVLKFAALFLLSIFSSFPPAGAEPDIKASLVAHWSLPKKFKFKKARVGGLSACALEKDILTAVSDDRGKFEEPRFYKFKLNLNPKEFTVTPIEMVSIKRKERGLKLPEVLDLEGVTRLGAPSGKSLRPLIVLSSEGDNDHKPRVPPQLLITDLQGSLISLINMPDELTPEPSGPQRKGNQNNKALEGLNFDPKSGALWVAYESPVIQDLDVEGGTPFVRILRVNKALSFLESAKGVVDLPPAETLLYPLEPSDKNENGVEVFKGVSEILVYENNLLVLERGVRLAGAAGWNHSVKLFSIDLKKAKLYSGTIPEKLKIQWPEKKLVLDFEKKNTWGLGAVENFEGLCLGPTVDGSPSLFVISDDNFSESSRTQIVWLKLK